MHIVKPNLFVVFLSQFLFAQQTLPSDSLSKNQINLKQNLQMIQQQLALSGNQKTEGNKKFRFTLGKENKGLYRDNFTNKLYYQNGFGRTKVNTNQ